MQYYILQLLRNSVVDYMIDFWSNALYGDGSVHKVLKIMHHNQWAFKNVNDLGAKTTALGIKTKL